MKIWNCHEYHWERSSRRLCSQQMAYIKIKLTQKLKVCGWLEVNQEGLWRLTKRYCASECN
jgi:hypothetical protein